MASKSRPIDNDPRWTSKLKPAPGDLRRVQSFLNTANPAEQLTSPEALADWLALWDLVPSPQDVPGVSQAACFQQVTEDSA